MQEGENDAKFYQHPTNKWSKKIYGVLHHRLYYFLHFVVSILLMLLVFAEEPAVGESSLNHSKRKLLTTVSHLRSAKNSDCIVMHYHFAGSHGVGTCASLILGCGHFPEGHLVRLSSLPPATDCDHRKLDDAPGLFLTELGRLDSRPALAPTKKVLILCVSFSLYLAGTCVLPEVC